MKNRLNLFMRCLEEAGRKMQDEHYFQLEVAGSEEPPIFRERVYCYELYHQLRLVTGDTFSYKLDGELDKHGHPEIEKKCGPKVPDFVVHKPGEMEENLVVIEVKPVKVNLVELKKDLKKLKCFLSKAEYHCGVMLLYGNGNHNLPQKIRDKVENCNEKRILLVWHSGPGEKPVVINRLNSHVG